MAHAAFLLESSTKQENFSVIQDPLQLLTSVSLAGTAMNSFGETSWTWSSRSNLRNYSGSSFLLAILWFWRLNLQLGSALTLLELKILLFQQSYFCRAARSCAIPEKGFYHERSCREASDPVSGSRLSSQAFLPRQSALSNLLHPDLSSKWFPESEWKDEATVGPVSSTL